ncbi:hypothetical protein EYF80_041651 [Liparis tanakae]|uniref:Uncharacterized protein n=1 Tax=Liparis tanakae TaxID=230148 RepID=A0A4Z2G5I6_9TELE|nr:hypothetical protein EYF80_041651 [Liparis tanakae]
MRNLAEVKKSRTDSVEETYKGQNQGERAAQLGVTVVVVVPPPSPSMSLCRVQHENNLPQHVFLGITEGLQPFESLHALSWYKQITARTISGPVCQPGSGPKYEDDLPPVASSCPTLLSQS